MKHALDKIGAPAQPDDVLASFIGPSLRGTFATLLETSDRGLIERVLAFYREEYGDAGLFENHVYDGVGQMLDHVRLITSGLFVATLKPKAYADRIVHHLGLDRYFAGVYGPELEGRFDDKIDLLAHLLATEGISAERAVMIGDRAATSSPPEPIASGRSGSSGAMAPNPSWPTPVRTACAHHQANLHRGCRESQSDFAMQRRLRSAFR